MNITSEAAALTRKLAPWSILWPLVACYGAAPGRPPQVPLPPLADAPDARVSVHSESKTTIENVTKHAQSCPSFRTEGDTCVDTTYQVAEPVTRTTTTAKLDGEPITYAQFAVITDPKWNDKLTQLDELSHKCTRANVPRYAGIGMMLGGLALAVAVRGEVGKDIATGGLIGGAGSYTLGFFAFGGSDCVRARALYDAMNMSRAMEWQSVEGEDYAREMREVADKFNATHGGATTVEAAPVTPTTPAPKPPAKSKLKTKPKPKTTVAMHMRNSNE